MNDRQRFEEAIGGAPYERDIGRYPDDPKRFAWPGSYRHIDVQLAWCMWQEGAKQAIDKAKPPLPLKGDDE